MQLDRWLRSRDLTSVFTPSEVERKRVTSFMHSLNPALYLLRTVASAESAAGGKERWRILVTHSWLCDSFNSFLMTS